MSIAVALNCCALVVSCANIDAVEQRRFQPPAALRRVHVKLPIRDAIFHWEFEEEAQTLKGKLLVTIRATENEQSFSIFKKGKLSKDWVASVPKAALHGSTDSLYFSFTSTRPLDVPKEARVVISFKNPHDLPGCGPFWRGYLPAGEYSATGTVSVTSDRDAWIETWEAKWPLIITSDKGWLDRDVAANLWYSLMSDLETRSRLPQPYRQTRLYFIASSFLDMLCQSETSRPTSSRAERSVEDAQHALQHYLHRVGVSNEEVRLNLDLREAKVWVTAEKEDLDKVFNTYDQAGKPAMVLWDCR